LENSFNIHALINLLDDPDELVFHHIRDEIMNMGPEVIPDLEEVWEETSMGELFQSRIESIIHDIQFNSIQNELLYWKAQKSDDLLYGMYVLSKFQYPELTFDELDSFFKKLTQDIWIELHEGLTALEKMRIVNHILYDVYGFKGDSDDYLAPQNSYLNDVIARKKGNPISLSILNVIIAQRLGLPIKGINLPRHFIVAWQDDYFFFTEESKMPILFYVNPFSKGTIFSRRDVEQFLQQVNIPPKEIFFTPCSNLDIMKRVINNLINSYSRKGNQDKVDDLIALQELFNAESSQSSEE
jgi:regulator of sirC expression with transglutaminase-like and TPR domain